MMFTNFSQALWLDGDAIPIRDPVFLFETKEFIETGAVYWPDIFLISRESKLWTVFDQKFRPSWSCDSGLLMLDKNRHWRAMMLDAFVNQKQSFYYALNHGDKDIWIFSHMKFGEPFFQIPYAIWPVGRRCGTDHRFWMHTFGQNDNYGRLLFLHMTGNDNLVEEIQSIYVTETLKSQLVYAFYIFHFVL